MLEELGLRLPRHAPRLLTDGMIRSATRVVTMGCIDTSACPRIHLPDRTEDWELPDPGPLDDDGFRAVRDRICARVIALRAELAVSPGRSAPRRSPS